MKNYLIKVENLLIIPKHKIQDNLAQDQGSKGCSATSDVCTSHDTVGFSQNRDIIALVHKNPLYVEYTRYSGNILLIYFNDKAHKHNSTIVSDASPGTAAPKMNEYVVHMAMCLLTVHAHRMAT